MKLLQAQNKLLLDFLNKCGFNISSEKLLPVEYQLESRLCYNSINQYSQDILGTSGKNASFSSKDGVYHNLKNTFALNQITIKNELVDLKFQGNHEVATNLTRIMTSQINKDIKKKKLIRITTVSGSLRTLLTGQLRFMNEHFEVVGVSNFGESLGRVQKNEGVRTQGVKMTRAITPLQDLRAAYKLYRFLRKEKPFIVHTHTPKAGTLGMLAARMAGVPHRLHTVAGLPLLEVNGIKRKLLDSVEKLTYLCATKVLPNSFGLKDIIVRNNYTKPEKLKVIGKGSSNGIDTSFYDSSIISTSVKSALKKKLGISEEDLVFIFVGRIVKDKGINELVRAFNSLSEKHKNCKLIIVGPRENNLDPILPITETLIKENNQIIDVDYQDDIRPYVAISHVLAFPSYREGFPNVVLQASSMGLPCIVTNINGCNEIIEHNVNGLIIEPKSSEDIENAMTFMIDNPTARIEMTKYTRSRIIERYEQDFVWKELLNFYKTLE